MNGMIRCRCQCAVVVVGVVVDVSVSFLRIGGGQSECRKLNEKLYSIMYCNFVFQINFQICRIIDYSRDLPSQRAGPNFLGLTLIFKTKAVSTLSTFMATNIHFFFLNAAKV